MSVNNQESELDIEKEPTRRTWWHIDKNMMRYKIHFFLFNGGMGTIIPFIPVVAKNRIGLSATSLAVIINLKQLITIVFSPLIGYIADHFNKLKVVITILIVLQATLHFMLLAIPPIQQTLSASPMKTFNELVYSNRESEVAIILLKLCNISFQSLPAVSELKLNDSYQFQNKNDATMCVKLLNDADIYCNKFHDEIYETITNFQIERSCICSITTMQSDILMNSHLYDSEFSSMSYLSIIEPNVISQITNKSFLCSVAFLEDNISTEITINQFTTFEFWIFAIMYTAAGLCYSSILSLGTAACCESVQKHHSDFGRQLVFGTFGWGSLAPISGLICDLTNGYVAAWILMFTLQILVVCNMYKLEIVKVHFSQNIRNDVVNNFKSFSFLAFELAVFMNGIGYGILVFYLVWFLSSLGGSTFLIGLAIYVECFGGEIPLMFFSGWIIKKVGHFNLMSLALICYGIRFLWYSYLKDPWLVLPVEILHGITYGTFYPTLAAYGKLIGKPGTEAVIQSIMLTTYESLGSGVGCFIAGLSFDYYGEHQTFFYASLFAFSGALLNIVNTILITRRNNSSSDTDEKEKVDFILKDRELKSMSSCMEKTNQL